MTQDRNDFLYPWSLHFDRDGTEDVAYLADANGDDLVVSRPFWRPTGTDPIPATLAAVTLMAAAPRLFHALDALLRAAADFTLPDEAVRTEARLALAAARVERPSDGQFEMPLPDRPSPLTRRIETEWVPCDPAADGRRAAAMEPANPSRRAMRIGHVLTWCLDWDSGREGLIALLTDARHWCVRHGESFAELDATARDHFLAEFTSHPKGPTA